MQRISAETAEKGIARAVHFSVVSAAPHTKKMSVADSFGVFCLKAGSVRTASFSADESSKREKEKTPCTRVFLWNWPEEP
jgi:hypothetical protein